MLREGLLCPPESLYRRFSACQSLGHKAWDWQRGLLGVEGF